MLAQAKEKRMWALLCCQAIPAGVIDQKLHLPAINAYLMPLWKSLI